MNEEHTIALREAGPLLYRGCNLPSSENLMIFGFECGDGWFNLLMDLTKKIESILEEMPQDKYLPMASQVKEKFAGLRFYMNCATDEIYDLIEKAEQASETICEGCGAPGEVRSLPWIRSLCEKHYQEVLTKILDNIVETVDELLLAEKFNKVDELLQRQMYGTNMQRMRTAEIICYLTVSFAAKDKLAAYDEYLERAKQEVAKREKDPDTFTLLFKGF